VTQAQLTDPLVIIGLATVAGCQLVAKDIFLYRISHSSWLSVSSQRYIFIIGLATVAGCQLVAKDIFLL
jgi:HAMP domain-containing protein